MVDWWKTDKCLLACLIVFFTGVWLFAREVSVSQITLTLVGALIGIIRGEYARKPEDEPGK
jgi:hypothetical protein